MDKLLSLKGQYDVEYARVIVEEKDVIKEYDMGAFSFIRCKSCIIFNVKGGFKSVISPRMTALYDHVKILLDMKDDFENLSEDVKASYDTMISATISILNLPIYATCDDEFFFGIATDILKKSESLVNKYSVSEPSDETFEEDAEFENKMEAADSLLNETEEGEEEQEEQE